LSGGMKCLHTEAVQQLRNHIFFSAIVFSHQQKLSWQLHCTATVLCFHTQYNTGILLIPARICSYGVPCVSKLYIDSECIILIAGIYKCPGTFINHHHATPLSECVYIQCPAINMLHSKLIYNFDTNGTP